MTDVAKTLGQSAPLAATATKLYTGSAGGAVGSIVVNNRPTSGGNANVSIEIRVAGAGSTAADFKWEVVVAQGTPQTFVTAVGATDEVWVTTDIVGVNFNMDGFEL